MPANDLLNELAQTIEITWQLESGNPSRLLGLMQPNIPQGSRRDDPLLDLRNVLMNGSREQVTEALTVTIPLLPPTEVESLFGVDQHIFFRPALAPLGNDPAIRDSLALLLANHRDKAPGLIGLCASLHITEHAELLSSMFPYAHAADSRQWTVALPPALGVERPSEAMLRATQHPDEKIAGTALASVLLLAEPGAEAEAVLHDLLHDNHRHTLRSNTLSAINRLISQWNLLDINTPALNRVFTALSEPPADNLTDEEYASDQRRRRGLCGLLEAFHHPDLGNRLNELLVSEQAHLPLKDILDTLMVIAPQLVTPRLSELASQWHEQGRSMHTIYRWYLNQQTAAATDQAYQWMASRPIHRREIGMMQDLTDPRIIPILANAVSHAEIGRVRAMAIWGLYYRAIIPTEPDHIGHLSEALPAIQQLRASNDPVAQNFACWALLALGHADAIDDFAASLPNIPTEWQCESLAWIGSSAVHQLSVAEIQRLLPLYDQALTNMTDDREIRWTTNGRASVTSAIERKIQQARP